jgi:hypothetical protein
MDGRRRRSTDLGRGEVHFPSNTSLFKFVYQEESVAYEIKSSNALNGSRNAPAFTAHSILELASERLSEFPN